MERRKAPSVGPKKSPKSAPQAIGAMAVATTTGKTASRPSARRICAEREQVVLRYLRGPMSNDEIAARLYVSVNTIKTHLKNIYRKLGANRRREAVRKARDLHLL